jgi:hypothetical protein
VLFGSDFLLLKNSKKTDVNIMEDGSSTSIKEYTKVQKTIAAIFYVLIVIACIVTLGGVVWTFADMYRYYRKIRALFRS